MNTATRLYKKFSAAGMTDAGIKGVLVNLWAESLLISINVENRSQIDDQEYTKMVDEDPAYDFATDNGKYLGYGLAQWTYPPRKRALLQFARALNVSIGDEDMQGDFLLQELRQDFPDLFGFLKSTNSIYDAADQFMRKFENPAVKTDRTKYLPQIEELLKEMEPTYWPPRRLEYGMTGADVEVLQAILKARGYPIHYISGNFDAVCQAAVNRFKDDQGLGVPGVVGSKTWKRLLKTQS